MKAPIIAVLLAAAVARAQSAGYDGGFYVQSEDGRNRLQVGALLQTQARAFQPDRGRETEFVLERMRLEFSGHIDGVYRFMLEPNFATDQASLEEAWIGADLPFGATLILGRMKEPFGLEEMLPRAPQDWVNFSILNQFSPAEDLGVTLLGECAGGALEYGCAVYNGNGDQETNSDKDIAARLVWHPFHDEDSAWQGLQLGVAGTWGRADGSLDGEALTNEAKQDFLDFADGSSNDGRRWRTGLEAAWVHGPFSALGEMLLLEQEMRGTGGAGDVRIDGGYVGFSWVLTGEDKTWKGVVPARPVGRGKDAGSGAWQFATRISRLGLDPMMQTLGVVGSTGFADSVTTIDAGLNWYLTRHAMIRMHAVWTDYDEQITIAGNSFSEELAFLLQAQLTF